MVRKETETARACYCTDDDDDYDEDPAAAAAGDDAEGDADDAKRLHGNRPRYRAAAERQAASSPARVNKSCLSGLTPRIPRTVYRYF